jgi:hypothetical protein
MGSVRACLTGPRAAALRAQVAHRRYRKSSASEMSQLKGFRDHAMYPCFKYKDTAARRTNVLPKLMLSDLCDHRPKISKVA